MSARARPPETAPAAKASSVETPDADADGQTKQEPVAPLELGLLRIRAVAQATGISADTLRVWERRYGNLASRRSASGYRLYTDADVRKLRRIRRLTGAGHSIGEIAALPEEELDRLVAKLAPRPEPPLAGATVPTRARFLEAIYSLDAAAADRAIGAARLVLPPLELVREIVLPLLHEIGERWTREEITIAQEHAASAVLRSHLGDVLRTLEAPLGAPSVICATPEGELHEFGALISGIVAGTQGFRVLYLGTSVPAADLARAAVDSGARAALLSCVALPAEAAKQAVLAVRRALPRAITLIVGGAPPILPPVAGLVAVRSLDELPVALAPLRS